MQRPPKEPRRRSGFHVPAALPCPCLLTNHPVNEDDADSDALKPSAGMSIRSTCARRASRPPRPICGRRRSSSARHPGTLASSRLCCRRSSSSGVGATVTGIAPGTSGAHLGGGSGASDADKVGAGAAIRRPAASRRCAACVRRCLECPRAWRPPDRRRRRPATPSRARGPGGRAPRDRG